MTNRIEHQADQGETREASKALTAWGLGLAIVAAMGAVFGIWGLIPLLIGLAGIVLAVLGGIRNPATRNVASCAAVLAAVAAAITLMTR
ncbi:hypothetical protein [Microbacterium sp. VKM Ac-2923]|uniref:hypothetical protein n=1 Tax=Microbacterium sp. VKM Ac-2923 TaxID=2929476 RepID=UPI001FB430F2|nr:hypothetical protein [Microbacterium sp. VKM Ac-2923]MCJ1709241.1 hypothetical protein [Microbacterium sp. VKM Ac-2923]